MPLPAFPASCAHSVMRCPCFPPSPRQVIGDDAYLDGDFISTVQQRGAAIIKVGGRVGGWLAGWPLQGGAPAKGKGHACLPCCLFACRPACRLSGAPLFLLPARTN